MKKSRAKSAGFCASWRIRYTIGMISWKIRRRIVYLSVLLLFAGLFMVFWSIRYFYEKPTCTDGVRNQGELGVDCGGPCPSLCGDERNPPSVLWTKVFRVREGEYSVVSRMENPSLSFSGSAKYYVRLYDSANVLVAERAGEMYLPPKRAIAFFEAGLPVGDRVATRAVFEFSAEPKWTKVEGIEPDLKVVNARYDFDSATPYFMADVENHSLWPIGEMFLTLIIYDRNGNAVGASRTVLDGIKAESSENVIFTWPQSFAERGARFEVLYWKKPN